MTKEELELKELEELEELERLEQMEAGDQEVNTAEPIDLTVGLEDIGRDPEAVQASQMGLVEGVPFAKDAIAGGQALLDGGIDNFSQKYDIKKQEIQEEINTAKEKNPYAFFAGEMTSSMALPLGSAKGLKGYGVSAAYGGLGELSRSEDRSVADVFEGMAYGVIGEGVGRSVGKGMSALKGYFTDLGKKGVAEAAGGMDPTAKGLINDFADRYYYSDGMTQNEVIGKFADDVLSLSDDVGEPLLNKFFQNPFETSKRALKARSKVGFKLGKVLDEASDNLGKMDGEEIFNRMVNELDLTDDVIGATQDKVMRKHKLNLRETLKEQFLGKPKRVKVGTKTSTSRRNTGFVDEFSQPIYEESTVTEDVFDNVPQFKEFTLKQLHQLKTEMGGRLQRQLNRAKFDGLQSSIMDEDLLKTMGKLSGIINDGVGEGTDAATKAVYKELNRKFQVALMVEDLALKQGRKTWQGPLGAFKEAIASRGIIAGVGASTIGAPTVISGGILVAINKLTKDPRTSSALAQGALKIGNFIKSNPESKFVERLIINSQLSSEEFRKALFATAAEISLIETAVARDSDAALTRSDDILAAARFKDEELANQMQDVFESGNPDSIGAFMDGLSKDPELGKYFEPGIGFNGKVYDPQDKAMLEEQLRANDDIPYAQKLQLIDDLNKNGTIPQPQEQAPDFMEFITRNKDKPEY